MHCPFWVFTAVNMKLQTKQPFKHPGTFFMLDIYAGMMLFLSVHMQCKTRRGRNMIDKIVSLYLKTFLGSMILYLCICLVLQISISVFVFKSEVDMILITYFQMNSNSISVGTLGNTGRKSRKLKYQHMVNKFWP